MADDLRELCERLVPLILARRGYELVEEVVAFTAAVLAEVQTRLVNNRRALEKIVEDAVVNRYGYIWHAACGKDGTREQRRAFEELHHYLYPIALHCAKHEEALAEESTQEALLIIWQQLDRVRDAGAFARFASVIVYHEVSRRLKRKSPEIGLDESPTSTRTNEDEIDRMALKQSFDPPESAPEMTAELRAKLEAAIKACLSSEQQAAVIIGLFFDDKGFKAIADERGTTVENISVLKSRALKRLKDCAIFMNVLEDLL